MIFHDATQFTYVIFAYVMFLFHLFTKLSGQQGSREDSLPELQLTGNPLMWQHQVWLFGVEWGKASSAGGRSKCCDGEELSLVLGAPYGKKPACRAV